MCQKIIFTYDYAAPASPLVQKLTRPNGSFTEYEYNDPLKRLTAILNKNNAGAIISKYDYTYNTLDLKDTETITGGVPLDNLVDGTTGYTPNDVNQLINTTNPKEPTPTTTTATQPAASRRTAIR